MFEDKVIFITGGASGLGRVFVEEFIKNGGKVFFTYRNSEDKAKELLDLYKEKAFAVKADASDYEEAADAVNKCLEVFGRIDVLINNAASARDASLTAHTFEKFDYTMRNVLYPVFNYSKAVCEPFIAQNKGKIINIGSINGIRGREGSVAYSTAKAGIIGFTKTIAKELGRYNINCNVVAPGFIDTEGQANTSELIKKLVLDECAIKKLTKPTEICNMVLFLASDKADNITGQVYQVDCGQYI
jgi:3-oxoacyl-[acyl-carrier protein] reductase